MKDMLKNKKLLAIIGGGLIVLAIIITCIVLNVNKKEDAPVYKEETHNMFVKINPFVKLVFKEEYYLCKSENGKDEICGEQTNKVVGYELINDDAKTFYKDLEFTNKDLYEVLLMLCETARDNNIGFESLEITTDSNNITNEKVLDYLKNNSKYEVNYSVYVNFEEHINEENILKDEGIENKIYLVTFNSDGGNKIESQTIDKGNKVSKPANPTKNGYKFVEWQLDGKTFDFNTEITQDVTLKAKWEKEKTNTQNNQGNTSNTNTETKPNNNTEKPKEELKSIEAPSSASMVELRNAPAKSSATLVDNIPINITISGEKSLFDTYSPQDLSWFHMYVDLSTLSAGTHKVKIQLENTVSGFTYKISPETIQVKISSMSSTIDKINLNDNILISYAKVGTACSKYVFSSTQDFEQAKSELEKLKSQKIIGIKSFNYSVSDSDNKIGYNYYILDFKEDYGGLQSSLKSRRKSLFDNKLNNIFSKATYDEKLGCGYDDSGTTLLTESLCNEYNLTCGRW